MGQSSLEKSKKAIRKVIENPNLCPNCGKPLDNKGIYGNKGIYCKACSEEYEDYIR